MPGQAIGLTMNIGYPGSYSRNADCIIAARGVKSTDTANINFGDPVILNSDNTYSKFGAGNTAVQFAGIAVREVKQSTDYFSTAGAYLPGTSADVITRGAVVVTCNAGTPTAGGKVYVRTVANGANTIIGGFEAAADSTNTVEITNAKFTTGKMDSNKCVEVTILSRNA